MSYKIVAAESRRGLEITLCPSAWEENGILSWPLKMVTRLQKDAASHPEPHWSKHNCVVKKSGIGSYEDALEWESAYQNVDTDAESELMIRKPRQILKQLHNNTNNFDSMFEGIENLPNTSTKPVMVLDSNARSSTLNTPSPTRIFKTNIVPNLEKPMPSNFSPGLNNYLPKPNADSPCLIDLPVLQIDSESQAEVNKKLDALQSDVNDVKLSIASLQQQLNVNTIKIMTVLDNIIKDFKMGPEKNLAEPSGDDNIILEKYALPLNEIQILKDMDKDLSQEKYFRCMMAHFSYIVGTDGQGRGEVLGKKMAELIMTRDLMTKMSWTGVSRTAEWQRKFAFQSLENIVKLFYKVLLKADSRWSFEKTEKLFSGALLKHAKKRAIAEKEKVEKKKKLEHAINDSPTPPQPSETDANNDTATPSQPSEAGANNETATPSQPEAGANNETATPSQPEAGANNETATPSQPEAGANNETATPSQSSEASKNNDKF